LILRQDNCDERLMPIAYKLGTVTDEQYDGRRRFWDDKKELSEMLGVIKVTPDDYNRMTGRTISQPETALDLLRRPEVGIDELLGMVNIGQHVDIVDVTKTIDHQSATIDNNVGAAFCRPPMDDDAMVSGVGAASCRPPSSDCRLTLGVESDVKYEGFVRKQLRDIERMRRYENARIPDGFSYDDVLGLGAEPRQKLKKICPATLGQASRVAGVTPADISVLAMYLLKSM
jgi:tRNA uridine 5-carboxymethylaminomethyl modification enzyme